MHIAFYYEVHKVSKDNVQVLLKVNIKMSKQKLEGLNINPSSMSPTTLAEDSMNDRHQLSAPRIHMILLAGGKEDNPCVNLVFIMFNVNNRSRPTKIYHGGSLYIIMSMSIYIYDITLIYSLFM